MKKYLLTCLFFVVLTAAKAQTYSVSQIPYNPLPFDSGIAVVSAVDDMWGTVLGIGFDFYFFGHPYQNLVVGTNGQITFDTTQAGLYEAWSLLASPPLDSLATHNSIMFPYEDLNCALGGTVSHQVYGLPPNRKFVVAFDSVPFFNSNDPYGCINERAFTGEVVLYEGSNNIEIYIHDKDTCTSWNNGLAVEGIRNIDGSILYTVPGRNDAVWAAHNDAWQFSPDSAWSAPAHQNRISGRVFADLNVDCSFDSVDYGLRNKPVIFTNTTSGSQSYIFTDLHGYYSKQVDSGYYNFTTYNLANHLYTTACPVTGSYNVYFPFYGDSSDNNLFADTINAYCSALVPGLSVHSTNGFMQPINSCDSALLTLYCVNNGTGDDSAVLILTMNDSVRILNSASAYTQVNGSYQFDVGVLSPGADTTITVLIQVGCDTLGTSYCFDVVAQGDYGHLCNSQSNTDNFCRTLGQPFDPNTMKVSSIQHPEKGLVPYLMISDSDELNYMVTFQNTGNSPAHNVELRIPLSGRIDSNTLTPTIASYPYSWLVLNKTLVVDFNGINLPDTSVSQSASEGYFKFRVKQAFGNLPGDSIVHNANIYFDQNAPISTNNAIAKIVADTVTTGLNSLTSGSIQLYPNPAHSTVRVITQEISQIRITDITGKLILAEQLGSLHSTLNVGNWANGIYLISVYSDKYSSVFKFVKE